jgi:hypothetical protein
METALVLMIIFLVYSVAVFLFMRFFAFVRNCDSEMRKLIGTKKPHGRFSMVSSKKKKTRKARIPRLAHA